MKLDEEPEPSLTTVYWRAGYREGFQAGLDTILSHLFGAWQEVLAHNLAIAAALCRAHTLGEGFGYEWATREPIWPRWEPGCKQDASKAEAARKQPGAFADIYGDRSKWRVL